MLRLAGGLLLMAGCIGLGINKVAEENERIRRLREILGIILRLQNEMRYGKRTLPEVCLLLSGEMEEPYKTVFNKIFQRMEENDGRSFENIWREEIEEVMRAMPLKEEEKDVLPGLPVNAGILEEDAAALNIGQSLDIIEERIRRAQEEYEGKSRVIMSISVMAGLFIIILLL